MTERMCINLRIQWISRIQEEKNSICMSYGNAYEMRMQYVDEVVNVHGIQMPNTKTVCEVLHR